MSNRRGLGLAVLLGLGIGGFVGDLAAQSGGLVATEYHPVSVEAGPAPDVALFATGDTMGKIEPCG